MSFLTQQDLAAGDHKFRQAVRHAVLKAAVAVAAEGGAADTPRKRLAGAVLSPGGADQYLAVFAPAVVTNGAISGNSLDADVEFTVNSMWDAVAGPFAIPSKPLDAAPAA